MKPVLLDLFCGGGAAAMGYHQAGFAVIGVDIEPQPNYPFQFVQGDALDVLAGWDLVPPFHAVHASPTCQRKCRVTAWRGRRENHPNTLTPTLKALRRLTTVPWVVENVPEAADELRPDVMLCGTQFGLNVKRHRIFEFGNWSAFDLMQPCRCWRNPHLVPFEHKDERAFADAMGCTWMTNLEGRQAIPPAFTHWIGERLLAHMATKKRVAVPPATR